MHVGMCVCVCLCCRHAGVGPEHIVSTAGVLHPLISLPSYQKEEEGGERLVHVWCNPLL